MTAHFPYQETGLSPQNRVIPLRGFSGCRVVLVDTGQDVYVRKLAKDADYNKRLLSQAEKQNAFTNNRHFPAVKIRATGILPSGLAYIDMDYVQGITAAEMLETLPLADIQRWAEILLGLASSPSQTQTARLLSPEIFRAKIASLQRDLAARGITMPVATRALEILQNRPWDAVPASACHGDLTLENIIVSNGRFYLIDFLDSFADSWHIDAAKLLQDLAGGWSFRHRQTDRNLILRLASLRHSIETTLNEIYPGCMSSIHDLYMLGLLRILPYSSAPEDIGFIESRLTTALSRFL